MARDVAAGRRHPRHGRAGAHPIRGSDRGGRRLPPGGQCEGRVSRRSRQRIREPANAGKRSISLRTHSRCLSPSRYSSRALSLSLPSSSLADARHVAASSPSPRLSVRVRVVCLLVDVVSGEGFSCGLAPAGFSPRSPSTADQLSPATDVLRHQMPSRAGHAFPPPHSCFRGPLSGCTLFCRCITHSLSICSPSLSLSPFVCRNPKDESHPCSPR
jgi:hypothetical protein